MREVLARIHAAGDTDGLRRSNYGAGHRRRVRDIQRAGKMAPQRAIAGAIECDAVAGSPTIEVCDGLQLTLDVARLKLAEGNQRIDGIDNVIACFCLPNQMQSCERVS